MDPVDVRCPSCNTIVLRKERFDPNRHLGGLPEFCPRCGEPTVPPPAAAASASAPSAASAPGFSASQIAPAPVASPPAPAVRAPAISPPSGVRAALTPARGAPTTGSRPAAAPAPARPAAAPASSGPQQRCQVCKAVIPRPDPAAAILMSGLPEYCPKCGELQKAVE